MIANVKSGKDAQGLALYDHIRKAIQSGELSPGDRILPTRKLQEQFEISYAATLAGLHRLRREGFIVLRPGSGTFVSGAMAGARGRVSQKHIAIVRSVDERQEAFYRPLMEALIEQLRALGATVAEKADPGREYSWDRIAAEKGDARVWVRPIAGNGPPSSGAGVVLVAHDFSGVWATATGYDVVTADYPQGGAVAGEYLRGIGCRSVAIAAVRDPHKRNRPGPIGARRIAGFEKSWGAPVEHVFMADRPTALDGAVLAKEFLSLKSRPEAVFAIPDAVAAGFCHGLNAHGVQAGKDVKVVGFNGQPPIYEEDPRLTSVKVPMDELGRMAAMLAIERADEPKRTTRRVNVACSLFKGVTA